MTDAKKRILARRAKFMSAAIASVGLTATAVLGIAAEGCGGEVERTAPQGDGGDTAVDDDMGPGVCLTQAFDTGSDDTGSPSACLTASFDSGPRDTEPRDAADATAGDTYDGSVADTGPEPCLFAPVDSGPAPCLRIAPDSGSD